MTITTADKAALKEAKVLLEKTNFAMKAADFVGEKLADQVKRLPAKTQESIMRNTAKALTAAIHGATWTMDSEVQPKSNWFHKVAVATTGGLGGFFGFVALSVELPVSTMIMLRSIADNARSNGEDITSEETLMACLEVFALGSGAAAGEESSYLAIRAQLAKLISDAVSSNAATATSRPVLAKLIEAVAEKFNVQVGEKLVATVAPFVGAISGAGVNLMFMQHFQDKSLGHFTVRRLERKYGAPYIQELYTGLAI